MLNHHLHLCNTTTRVHVLLVQSTRWPAMVEALTFGICQIVKLSSASVFARSLALLYVASTLAQGFDEPARRWIGRGGSGSDRTRAGQRDFVRLIISASHHSTRCYTCHPASFRSLTGAVWPSESTVEGESESGHIRGINERVAQTSRVTVNGDVKSYMEL
jgi:hypothetical protein